MSPQSGMPQHLFPKGGGIIEKKVSSETEALSNRYGDIIAKKSNISKKLN